MDSKAPAFLFLLLPLFAGCARSSDGTVMIPHMVDARRIWDKGATGTHTPPVQSLTVFPVAPVSERSRYRPSGPKARQRKAESRHVQGSGVAVSPAAEPSNAIACGPVQNHGERVQMTCQ